jgi:7-keto-8-aminopelargonate synthetase-like enzyme
MSRCCTTRPADPHARRRVLRPRAPPLAFASFAAASYAACASSLNRARASASDEQSVLALSVRLEAESSRKRFSLARRAATISGSESGAGSCRRGSDIGTES